MRHEPDPGKLLAAGFVIGVLLLITGQSPGHNLPPGFVSGALCIHRYEGSWTDAGAPYYGGLQMDIGFQRTYGTWLLRNRGTADHWTPHQQLHIAYRAYKGWKGYTGRGYTPWPNTARKCGLL